VFSCQEPRKPKKLKKKKNQTTLHSPKRLGGLKPPLEQVQGDSKLHSPSGCETLASTGIIHEGTKISLALKWLREENKIREEGGLEPPSFSDPYTQAFSLSFRPVLYVENN
jgi:hypothetical protein